MLGQIFIKNGVCSSDDIDRALEVQKSYGGKIGTILLNMGIVTETQLCLCLSEQLEIQFIEDVTGLEVMDVPVKKSFLKEYRIYPFRVDDSSVDVVCKNPLNLTVFSFLETELQKKVRPFLATEENLSRLEGLLDEENLATENLQGLDLDDEIDRLKELASEAPVIKLVNNLLSKAVERDASDVHFEAMRRTMRVRVRLDGVLHFLDSIPESQKPSVIVRLKLLSGMNIAENRLPQDGRIAARIAGRQVDIRASSVPTQFGESFVLRLLRKENIDYSLEGLGFYQDHIADIHQALKATNGVFLTTGPTGSGKTTTLYSMLNSLNSEEKKIVTVEDPVEYEFQGINQISVRADIGYTFANSLRSILRQDPDVIMVGEIRDGETAEIAIQAALTGHLVLSTLHTNSALASITRLLDMGVAQFLLNASVSSVMAQRLIRKLCSVCSEEAELPEAFSRKFKIPELLTSYPFVEPNYRVAHGCDYCRGTGFRGRLVIAEVIPFTRDLQKLFDDQPSFSDIVSLGYRSMLQDGILKVVQGKTTMDEVLQAAS